MWGKKGSGDGEFGNLHGIDRRQGDRLGLRRRHRQQPRPGVQARESSQHLIHRSACPGDFARASTLVFTKLLGFTDVHEPFVRRIARHSAARPIADGIPADVRPIGLCGFAGLTFVNRIGSTVEVATGVAAPLANDSAALLAGARRAREVLRAALDSTAETASSKGIEEIARIESDSRAGIERMNALIARNSLDLKVDNVTASLGAFADEARKILKADSLYDAKLVDLDRRFKSFETNRNELEPLLAKLAAANEATMGLREDSTKTLINSGNAKIDDFGAALDETFTNAYPNVKDAYKLLRNVVELQELARGHMSATDDAGLKSIEQRAEKLLKASIALHRRVATRLKEADLKAESTRVSEGFSRAGALLLGDGGAFAARRAALSTNNNWSR